MKRIVMCLVCAVWLGLFPGCRSVSSFGEDGHLNCTSVSQLKSVPRCKATVEEITPCSVLLKTNDGCSLALGGPGGADPEIVGFQRTLAKGQTYVFPNAFIEYLGESRGKWRRR